MAIVDRAARQTQNDALIVRSSDPRLGLVIRIFLLDDAALWAGAHVGSIPVNNDEDWLRLE